MVVREHLDLHMTKEEQILWPQTEEQFSPPEQATIVQNILAAIPKEEFPARQARHRLAGATVTSAR